MGAWDYQELPTGPAVHVIYKGDAPLQSWLEPFVATARAAGWPIYGAGFPFENKRDSARLWQHAIIVLEQGTDEPTLSEFLSWIDEQPSIELAAVPRTGTERYRG